MPQPSAVFHVAVRPDRIRRLDGLLDVAAIRDRLAPLPADRLGMQMSRRMQTLPKSQRVRKVVEQLAHMLVAVQESAGLPVAVRPQLTILSHTQGRGDAWVARFSCPALHPALIVRMAPKAIEILNIWLAGKRTDGLPVAIDNLVAELTKFVPGGQNCRLLLDAAYRLDVPARFVAGRTVQFGWGARARWMDSSITDSTPAIATRLARDKRATNKFLASHGVPVARQIDAPTKESASKAAKQIGFPVALKPADLDGGVGVTANIGDEDMLDRAYERARQFSARIVVEAHVSGDDYRIGVVGDAVQWVTAREPGGVRGDGVSTIAHLLELANRDVRRGTRHWSLMSPLSIDDDARALLDADGLAVDDVPEKDRFVRLRSVANISCGGVPRDISHRVHPDNLELAIRVARLMRLDIAGIDLITSDITRSWREVGAKICEVNAQPQFTVSRLDVPFRIMGGLFAGDGRIPVAVVLGKESAISPELLLDAFRARGLRMGLVLSAQASVDGCIVATGDRGTFSGVQALLGDPAVDALIALVDDTAWEAAGVPVDRIDLLLATPDASPRTRQWLAPFSMVDRSVGAEALSAPRDVANLADEMLRLRRWHDSRELAVERVASTALSASPYCRSAPPVPGSIGLCMIARDEAAVICESLDSARGLVDFVLVQDNGSTDGTQDVVRRWLRDNDVPGEVVETPWRDFAWNRTRAMADLRARHDIDYALILDADDVLVMEEGFEAAHFKAGLEADVYDLDVYYGALRFPRPQLLRNAKAFGYRGVLHEYVEIPLDSVGRMTAQKLHVQAHSRGARSLNRRKYDDDAALLEKALEQEQDPKLRSRYLFYLGQSYQDGRHFAKALDAYMERLAIDFWPDEKFVAAYRIGNLRARLGHAPGEIEAAFRLAMEIAPDRLEPYHGLSRYYRSTKRYLDGLAVATQGLPLAGQPGRGLFVESQIYHYGMLEEAALNAGLAGKHRACAEYSRAILALEGVPEQVLERTRRCLDAALFRQHSMGARATSLHPGRLRLRTTNRGVTGVAGR